MPNLFTPISLGSISLVNRIVMAQEDGQTPQVYPML